VSAGLVLASRSSARRAVLEGARVPFEATVSGVDEEALKKRLLAAGYGPKSVAQRLAEQKALAVSATRPELVVGADQTLELDGRLYDKVETLAQARERLRLLEGRRHHLHSAVAVARAGQVIWRETESATLSMRRFGAGFVDSYLAQEGEAALGSVGCYRLEGMGAQLFEAIEGDYFAILGLPLLGLLDFLRREGVLST
jgi:septum formation protein